MLIEEAAQAAGVELHEFISWLHRSGLLLVEPGTEDPRCHLWMRGFETHVDGCDCLFVLAPHPDIWEVTP